MLQGLKHYFFVSNRMIFQTVLAFLIVLISSQFGAPGAKAQEPEGYLHNSVVQSMIPRFDHSSYYYETWTYHIVLDNGIYIIYEFNITDFGAFKERVSGAKFQITWLDGKTHVARKEYNLNTFAYDSTRNKIELHPRRTYWAQGRFDSVHTVNFDTKKKGVDYHTTLELYDIAKSQIWGDGHFVVQGTEMSLAFPVPHAKVRGMVALNGDTLRNVSGVAFMDHIHIKDKVTSLFKRGHRIKIGDAQNGKLINVMQSNDSNRLLGYGIDYNNGKATLLKPAEIKDLSKGKVRGVQFSEASKLRFENGDTVEVTVDKVLDDYSILDELGGIQKFFAKKYLGGQVIEFNGMGHAASSDSMIFNYFIIDN